MIFLTGATGTVGSATVAALKARGTPFRVGVRHPGAVPALDAVTFDFDQPSTYASALEGVRVAFLLTPVSERQLEYTQEFAKAAKAASVERIVKLSVVGAEQEHGIAFQKLHGAGERALAASGAGLTFVRATAFMQNFVNHYGVNPRKDSAAYLPHGNGTVSWVDVRDVGEVIAATLAGDAHVGQAYALTGPVALGAGEVAKLLSLALGKAITYVDVPPAAASEGMAGMGMPAWMIAGLLELHAAIKAGYLAPVAPDIAKVLGRPAGTFEDYAKRLAREVA